ncbi:MAG: hypothetical protein HY873_03540, partial [Chloroflexi bacterium]|nr:hypothetical protein [Chloroflexota bacterium]
MRQTALGWLLLPIVALIVGCSGDKGQSSNDQPDNLDQFFTTGPSASADAGPEGGEVSLGGDIRLSVAPGSLAKTTNITLSRFDHAEDPAAPDPFSNSALIVTVEASSDV